MSASDFETASSPVPPSPKGMRRAHVASTVTALEELCDRSQPGDRIPTHTELMRLLGASERSVRSALAELQRTGRIIRKNGVGTFVAEPPRPLPIAETESTIVAITRPDDSFFDRCLELLFHSAEEVGLHLLCQPISATTPEPVLATPVRAPLGYILFSYRFAPLAVQLRDQGSRVVVVGVPPVDVIPEVPCIYNDHEHGGYLATRHLIDLGHRRIAYLQVGTNDLLRQWRWRGHQRALAQARRSGLVILDTVIPEVETNLWKSEPGRALAHLRSPEAPTALVAWNDHEAARLLAYLTRAGIRVPEEVSLIGYDALPEGELVYPTLTTIDHAITQQLRAAVNLLLVPSIPSPSHTVSFVPALIQRESTAPSPHL